VKLRLIELFERRAHESPDALSIREISPAERKITRGELADRVVALSARLIASIPPGGVVLICFPNQAEFTIAFLATLAAGLKAFPVSPELAEPELISAAKRSGATAIIGTSDSIRVLGVRVPLSISPEDIAALPSTASADRPQDTGGLLLLSSGTTGRPKIVFRDAKSLDAVSEAMATAIGFTESDHVLACVPLCHSYGIEHGLLAPLFAGSVVHLARGFELRVVLRELSNSAITILPGVPFMFEMLAQHGGGTTSLRRAYSAGGPLPRSVAENFQTKFHIPVTQLYGATEIGSVTYANPDLPSFDPASVGWAMKGVSIRIVAPEADDVMQSLPVGEQGHVAVAAGSMLREYWGEDSLTLPNGFFLTGDLGRLDPFGNLTITGRLKLLIDVGGLKVNPVEIEEVLCAHPDVASCIVVAMPVSETVSRLKAIVIPAENSAPPSPASLRTFARTRLAGYKVPRLFEIRESLPKSATGKILRHMVQA
jgi:acyl-CoA synthetase (AMP-forming)/AMP-acid ligase II